MANRHPFTAYFKIVPELGNGKRFEAIRSREKIANLVWNDLRNNLMEANIALPGGSGTWTAASSTDSISTAVGGVAVKPSYGEYPDMLTVVGFFDDTGTDLPSQSAAESAPYSQRMLISGGRVWTGPATGAPGYSNDTVPSEYNRALASTIKTALETSITSVSVELVGLEVDGVKYGWGGYHMP